LTKKQSSSVKY